MFIICLFLLIFHKIASPDTLFLWWSTFLSQDLSAAGYSGVIRLSRHSLQPCSHTVILGVPGPERFFSFSHTQTRQPLVSFGACLTRHLKYMTCPTLNSQSFPALPSNVVLPQSFISQLMTAAFFHLVMWEQPCHSWLLSRSPHSPISKHTALPSK